MPSNRCGQCEGAVLVPLPGSSHLARPELLPLSRMRRTLIIVVLVALLLVGAWWLLSPKPTPAARAARPYAREFALQLQHDTRFTNVRVGVWDFGSKGPLWVRGIVGSDSDATELRRRFDSLRCPVRVSWNVDVDTNQDRGAR